MSIKIVTDSTAELTREEIEKYEITVIPIQYSLNGKVYTDHGDISPTEFLRKMAHSPELPKTSQPSLGTFLECFKQLTADGSEVLAILVAGTLSGTVATAKMAAQECGGKVTVFDSQFISRALGFQVLEAAQMAKQGKTIGEIITRLERIRRNTKLYVILDTLENLVKGGRIGKGKALVSSLLNIKPIAAVEKGEYTPLTIARNYRQAIRQLVKTFKKDLEGKLPRKIAIVHADGLEMAKNLKQQLQESFRELDIPISETTPAISIHSGPGAIGLMFYMD